MHSQTALNYGRALVDLAKEKNILDQVLDNAKLLIEELLIPELQEFLRHPKIPDSGKKDILHKITAGNHPPEIFLNFLNLIIDRHREALLSAILEEVVEQVLKAKGFEIVELISAKSLSKPEQSKIQQQLEKVWQIKISLKYRENPNLIGGIVIRRGDELIDGSLAGQLYSLRRILIEETNIAANLI